MAFWKRKRSRLDALEARIAILEETVDEVLRTHIAFAQAVEQVRKFAEEIRTHAREREGGDGGSVPPEEAH